MIRKTPSAGEGACGGVRNKHVTLPCVTRVQTCYLYLKAFNLFHEKEFHSSLMLFHGIAVSHSLVDAANQCFKPNA